MLTLYAVAGYAAPTPWQSLTHPISGNPQSIGAFANGCIIGAQPLALNSPDYQVLRSNQRRFFGHPDMLAFIRRLSHQVQSQHMGMLLIGDIGMAAGGRFSSGHASHQTGLDVDIFLQLPEQRWTAKQLLTPRPLDLVSGDGRRVVASRWQPTLGQLIKLAASDADVSRIFVSPAIKQQLCAEAGTDRNWLHKVRPWFGHRAHMHVRLRCPADSPTCEEQAPPPAGDGCGAELQSWFAQPQPVSPPPKRLLPPLPPACQALLDKHVL